MPVRTIASKSTGPQENSLIVCAGTVTCTNVAGMGSGFLAFKKFFNQNLSVSDSLGGWQAILNRHLAAYHSQEAPMPAYIRLAQQDSYIGAVATVPVKGGKGLTLEKFSNSEARDKDHKQQYRQAVTQAIKDALALNRPLYIQPLGIGVYGWAPEEAAKLFAEMIIENDPEDQLDISIPIFDTSPSSRDMKFEQALAKELKHQRPLVETTQSQSQKKTGVSKPRYQTEQSNKTTESKRPLSANQIQLSAIIERLIGNIESKQGNRWTSGKGSQKVQALKDVKKKLQSTPSEEWGEKESEFLLETLRICEQKRSFFHFWATPESVTEFKTLLKKKGLELPDEKAITLNK